MRSLSWFFALLLLAVIAPRAMAHPFHLCTGEMEFNLQTGRWEVALKMHPSDLETAIRKRTGKKIDVTAREGSPEVIDYLTKHFQLRCEEPAREEEPVKIEFVGAELERGWLWVYFELPAPQGKGLVSLTHAILLDDVDKQANSVLVRNHGKRATLHFTSAKRTAASELLSAGK